MKGEVGEERRNDGMVNKGNQDWGSRGSGEKVGRVNIG